MDVLDCMEREDAETARELRRDWADSFGRVARVLAPFDDVNKQALVRVCAPGLA